MLWISWRIYAVRAQKVPWVFIAGPSGFCQNSRYRLEHALPADFPRCSQVANACSLGSTSRSRRSPVYMSVAFYTLFFLTRRAGVGFDVFSPRSVELSSLLLPRCVDMSGSSGVWLECSCFGSALRVVLELLLSAEGAECHGSSLILLTLQIPWQEPNCAVCSQSFPEATTPCAPSFSPSKQAI